MKILVINAGSSSVKYQLIDMNDERVLASGIVERIGLDEPALKHQAEGKDKLVQGLDIRDHSGAVKTIVDTLLSKEHGGLRSMDEIGAVGHRIAHGGDRFVGSALIDESVMQAIRDNIELAPLHNPANISGIEACRSVMPGTPMVAVFDTAYHQTLPPKAYLYGLSHEISEAYKIRRYGFHGTSHQYIAMQAARALGRDIGDINLITCHLGNGSSIAAIQHGRSMDTSMGFTPLEGLVMGTRCGDIDPSILQFLMLKKNMAMQDVMRYLNSECGVLGLSGRSSDFRDLQRYANEGDARCRMAIDVFCYRVKKYIGAYTAAIGGVDAIVFSGGIGENDAQVRASILEGLEYLGVTIDHRLNDLHGVEARISAPESRVSVLVIRTNEELMIAKDTLRLVQRVG